MHTSNCSYRILCLMAFGCLALTGCSNQSTLESPPALKDSGSNNGGTKAKFENYFLDKSEYADFRVTIPEPPKADSALFKNDIAVYKETRKYKGTKLWEDARIYANFGPDNMCRYFSESVGIELSKEKTPWTYYILGKLSGDAISGGTRPAKNFYMRKRPFVYFNDRTCSTKEDDDAHIKSGSYPSGHTALGELIGLVLTEIVPSRQNEIISAAHQYGDYRIICGFHWASDVDAGRKVAAYVNAKLHSNPEFLHAVEMAKKELSDK